MTGMFGVAMCLRERHFGDPTCCTWISQGSPRSETELRQYCHNAAKTLANVLVRRPPDISVWDTGFHANTERFQGLVPFLPHLCPLTVPKGGVCGVYSESP